MNWLRILFEILPMLLEILRKFSPEQREALFLFVRNQFEKLEPGQGTLADLVLSCLELFFKRSVKQQDRLIALLKDD